MTSLTVTLRMVNHSVGVFIIQNRTNVYCHYNSVTVKSVLLLCCTSGRVK